jgi:hypothetical protein
MATAIATISSMGILVGPLLPLAAGRVATRKEPDGRSLTHGSVSPGTVLRHRFGRRDGDTPHHHDPDDTASEGRRDHPMVTPMLVR